MALSCGYVDTLEAPGFSQPFPPHFHETFAIGVVEAGSVSIQTRHGRWTAGAGTVLAFAPGEVHAAQPGSSAFWSYRMLYPEAGLLERLGVLPESGQQDRAWFPEAVIHDEGVASGLAQGHRLLLQGSSRAEWRLRDALTTLFHRHAVPSRGGAKSSADYPAAVARAVEVMHRRFGDRLRLEDLGRECGVSTFHLVRSFHRAMGVPPHAYLVTLRVSRAQQLLSEGFRISEVALECGFADQAHLTRTFKRVVGVPPGVYALGMGLCRVELRRSYWHLRAREQRDQDD